MGVRSVVFCNFDQPYAEGVWNADLGLWEHGSAGGVYDCSLNLPGDNYISVKAYLDGVLIGTSPQTLLRFDMASGDPEYLSGSYVSTNGVVLVNPMCDVLEHTDGLIWGGLVQARITAWTDSFVDGPVATNPGIPPGLPPDITFPNVYIAGNFNMGWVSLNHVAKWNGKNTWTPVGAGGAADGPIYALVVDANEDVYVAGWFTHIGGIAVNGFAKWNGTSWSGLGFPGVCRGAAKLAISAIGAVYVIGAFNDPHLIYKWDGTAWGVDATADDQISCIGIAPNGDLWVGGQFTTINGVSAHHIAKRVGANWFALGAGLNYVGSVLSIAFDKFGQAYAAGSFTMLVDDTGSSIARWDGSTSWHPVTDFGQNPIGDINTLSFNANNDLFIGGTFSVRNLFKVAYGETTLSDVGNATFNFPVRASVVDSSGNLIVGGDFTTNNVMGAAKYMAFYTGKAWAQSDNTLNQAVQAIVLKPAAIKADTKMYPISFDVFPPATPVTKTVFGNISFYALEPQYSTNSVKSLVTFTVDMATATVSFNVLEPPPPVTALIDFDVEGTSRYLIDFSVLGSTMFYAAFSFYVNETFSPIGIPMTVREIADGTLTSGRKSVSIQVFQTVGEELILIASADASVVLAGATPGIWAEIQGIPQPYPGDIQIDGYVKGTLTYSQTLPYAANVGVQLA